MGGLIDKAKASPAAASISLPMLAYNPYKGNMEYRSGAPSNPATHPADYELFIVLKGSGTIVTGGTITGTTITGGKSQPLVTGDMIVIPKNTPHQLTATAGDVLVDFTLKMPADPVGWPVAAAPAAATPAPAAK